MLHFALLKKKGDLTWVQSEMRRSFHASVEHMSCIRVVRVTELRQIPTQINTESLRVWAHYWSPAAGVQCKLTLLLSSKRSEWRSNAQVSDIRPRCQIRPQGWIIMKILTLSGVKIMLTHKDRKNKTKNFMCNERNLNYCLHSCKMKSLQSFQSLLYNLVDLENSVAKFHNF